MLGKSFLTGNASRKSNHPTVMHIGGGTGIAIGFCWPLDGTQAPRVSTPTSLATVLGRLERRTIMKRILILGMLIGLLTSVGFAQRGRMVTPAARMPAPSARVTPDVGAVAPNARMAPNAITTAPVPPNARGVTPIPPTATTVAPRATTVAPNAQTPGSHATSVNPNAITIPPETVTPNARTVNPNAQQ